MGTAATCDHEAAMLIDDAELHRDFKGQTFFFCPACGGTLSDEGLDVGLDPTEPKNKAGDSHRPKNPNPPAIGQAGNAGKKLGKGSIGKSSRNVPLGTVQESIPGVAEPRQESRTVLPATTPRATQVTSLTRAAETLPLKTKPIEEIEHVKILDGPWKGLPCPALKQFACKGTMQPFFTLHSDAYGHSYFYRCETCNVKMILECKGGKHKL